MHTAMNKSEFLSAVAEHAEVSKVDAGRTVDPMIAVIKKAKQLRAKSPASAGLFLCLAIR